MNPTVAPPRVEGIDLIRGIAALAVALFHFAMGGPAEWSGGLAALIAAGEMNAWGGVEVFFVISGFVLPYAMARGRYRLPHFGAFLAKRILRLDPPYFAVIGLGLILWWASGLVPAYRGAPFEIEPVRLLLHVGYLNGFFGYDWYNPVFWTLAIEFQFYLLIAVVFPLAVSRHRAVRAAFPLLLAFTALALPDPRFVFHYLGLFALGIIAFQTATGLGSRAYFALLGLVVGGVSYWTLGPVVAGLGALTAFAIVFVRFPRIAPLTFLGRISYSLYLLHIPLGGRIVNLGNRFAHTLPLRILVLLAAVGASLAAAYLLYRFVERPAQRWSSAIRYRDPGFPDGQPPTAEQAPTAAAIATSVP